MASTRKLPEPAKNRRPPATTPEGRENQMINLAIDLAEKQILAGTASSQVITHYIKLGTTRERLEQERLAHENIFMQAKVDAMASASSQEELYKEALKAMRTYTGNETEEDYDDN